MLGIVLVTTGSACANELNGSERERQRRDYQTAKKALYAGRLGEFHKLLEQLQDYSLYPYLLYSYYRPRLWKIDADTLGKFMRDYPNLPMMNGLRSDWLRFLAKHGRWESFLEFYIPQKDDTLKCYQLIARIKTNRKAFLLEDIRSLWRNSAESMPKSCDPAFKLLYDSELMSSELAWERTRLSIQNGNIRLAQYLRRWLNPQQRTLLADWLAMHKNPAAGTARKDFLDQPIHREILLYGIRRLTRQNVALAVVRWDSLRDNFHFSSTQRISIDRILAVQATKTKHVRTVELMNRIPASEIDDDILHWRLRGALTDRNWAVLADWTSTEPADPAVSTRSRYWQARSLMMLGKTEAAHHILEKLAQERDYYGFLAAEHMGLSFMMNHYPLPPNRDETLRILGRPSMQRTYELLTLGENSKAIREWNYALSQMTDYQVQLAARMAASWGWHQRAILALAKVKAWDDLHIRFPLLFNDELQLGAEKQALDMSWVYAVVRAESAFIEDARSPAGALGLMQVMPKTGAMVAKRLGLGRFDARQLLNAAVNVPIGSAYMRLVLDRFAGNVMLATAAYNAGPGRVQSWLSRIGKNACIDADVWIELIPFNETRKYVRRVLFNTIVYDWRLEGTTKSILQRMPNIRGKNANPSSDCTLLSVRLQH